MPGQVPWRWVVWSGDASRIRLGSWSGSQQGLDGAALVHGPVSLGGLVEGHGEVEDLAGVDLPIPDEIDERGQEAAHWGGCAVQVHAGEEKIRAGQGDVVRPPDEADVAAGAGGVDGLQHRLLRADRLDRRMRTQPAGELLDMGYALVAALRHDVGGSEAEGQLLPGLVPAHRDDPLGAQLPRGEDAEQADGAVADDGDRRARAGRRGNGGEPPGA